MCWRARVRDAAGTWAEAGRQHGTQRRQRQQQRLGRAAGTALWRDAEAHGYTMLSTPAAMQTCAGAPS